MQMFKFRAKFPVRKFRKALCTIQDIFVSFTNLYYDTKTKKKGYMLYHIQGVS